MPKLPHAQSYHGDFDGALRTAHAAVEVAIAAEGLPLHARRRALQEATALPLLHRRFVALGVAAGAEIAAAAVSQGLSTPLSLTALALMRGVPNVRWADLEKVLTGAADEIVALSFHQPPGADQAKQYWAYLSQHAAKAPFFVLNFAKRVGAKAVPPAAVADAYESLVEAGAQLGPKAATVVMSVLSRPQQPSDALAERALKLAPQLSASGAGVPETLVAGHARLLRRLGRVVRAGGEGSSCFI